jgi:hypothetical protein
MKLLIMRYSPASRHFLPLRTKPPQHPVLKHSQLEDFQLTYMKRGILRGRKQTSERHEL